MDSTTKDDLPSTGGYVCIAMKLPHVEIDDFDEIIVPLVHGIAFMPEYRGSLNTATIEAQRHRDRKSSIVYLFGHEDAPLLYISVSRWQRPKLDVEIIGINDGADLARALLVLFKRITDGIEIPDEGTKTGMFERGEADNITILDGRLDASESRNTNQRGAKAGTFTRVKEVHRLLKQGLSLRHACTAANTDSRTYYTHCMNATGEEPILPYR